MQSGRCKGNSPLAKFCLIPDANRHRPNPMMRRKAAKASITMADQLIDIIISVLSSFIMYPPTTTVNEWYKNDSDYQIIDRNYQWSDEEPIARRAQTRSEWVQVLCHLRRGILLDWIMVGKRSRWRHRSYGLNIGGALAKQTKWYPDGKGKLQKKRARCR